MNAVEKLDNLVKLYHEERLAHVYLLETNNISLAFKDLITTIKKINCPNEYAEKCDKCNICNLINQEALPSLIIVNADGNNIKKEQVLDLKRRFSFKPIYTPNNIYIINNAEKLNGASANTMLKFIEEPGENIIGFLLTTNLNNVIPTIKSRCEICSLIYNIEENKEDNPYYAVALEYIKAIELAKDDKIMYNRNIILNKYSERNDIEAIFKEILNIYLRLSVLQDEELNLKLDSLAINKRINLLITFLEDIANNANIELLMDKFIIELSDSKNESI